MFLHSHLMLSSIRSFGVFYSSCSYAFSDQRNDDRSSEVLPVIACQIEKPRYS